MSRMLTHWTDADYDRMSWHDNNVHALSIRGGEDGTGTLTLDLDFILEWLPPVDGRYSFRIAPALLTFHDVFALRVHIDYATVSAAMTPFCIGKIARVLIPSTRGYVSYRWTITINWPEGAIEFDATGFEQHLTGEPHVSETQELSRP
jgi:hypothetical protein